MSADASKPRLSVTGSPEDYSPTYGSPVVSTSNDVALQSKERPAKPGGILESQTEQHGANYPGRPLPKAEKVVEAKDKPGTAKRCSEKQLQEQRQELK